MDRLDLRVFKELPDQLGYKDQRDHRALMGSLGHREQLDQLEFKELPDQLDHKDPRALMVFRGYRVLPVHKD